VLTRSSIRRTYRPTGPSTDVVDLVLERASYSCEVCNGMPSGARRGVDWSLHHRRPRQMGGSRWPGINLPSNLLLVCGSGVDLCHGDIESHRATAARAGYLVLASTDPAQVAVLLHKERWVYLDNSGAYRDAPPPPLGPVGADEEVG
jgi:hypothetical protein